MTDEKTTIVVEVRGPQQSGATSLAQLLTLWLRNYMDRERVVGPLMVGRSGADCIATLFRIGAQVEVREAEPDDRDTELASLRQEVDRLRQDYQRLKARGEELERRQVPNQPVSVERSILDTSELKISGTGTTTDGEYVTKARYDALLAEFVELEARMRGLEK